MEYIKSRLLLLILFAMFSLVGCSEEQIDYIHYEQMDEITIEGNQITIVLYENLALPYHWSSEIFGSGIELLEDNSYSDDGFSIQAGVADSYHVFVFECTQEAEGQILIYKKSVTTEGEIAETRTYSISYVDGKLTCNGYSE